MTPLFAMAVDPWILAFSAITVGATIFMGFWSAKKSKTASDFFVAGRSVSVGWNASAISGEYLSAASFMGVAGMVMSSGYDALWYPVCYACGYLFLLLFIAGPLRRFGAYTIPDFAEGRFDSPVFRKIAVVFVLFIGFFYTMPQMKGAGTTLAYIFPGLPYWAGVVLVGAVITLNVALGGMKGITLVQAFQYWAKMFAISVPIFVLMAVYGHYGKQLELNLNQQYQIPVSLVFADPRDPFVESKPTTNLFTLHTPRDGFGASPEWKLRLMSLVGLKNYRRLHLKGFQLEGYGGNTNSPGIPLQSLISDYGKIAGKKAVAVASSDRLRHWLPWPTARTVNGAAALRLLERTLRENGFVLLQVSQTQVTFAQTNVLLRVVRVLPAKAPTDSDWLSPFGPLTTKAAKAANASVRWNLSADNRAALRDFSGRPPQAGFSGMMERAEEFIEGIGGKKPAAPPVQFSDWTNMPPNTSRSIPAGLPMLSTLREYGLLVGRPVMVATNLPRPKLVISGSFRSRDEFVKYLDALLLTNGVRLSFEGEVIKGLASADWETYQRTPQKISFVPNRFFGTRVNTDIKALAYQYGAIREGGHTENNLQVLFATNFPTRAVDFNPNYDLLLIHEARPLMEKALAENGVTLIHANPKEVWAVPTSDIARYQLPPVNVRAYSLLYTYSLIIALVCGTAGLPHILVRFYTNPDGVAAKRTTMWVMILIGIFYVFPPVFGVMGRNLLPDLYAGVGAKGTDKIVLELPRILNERFAPLGSILSGITCAGAFAAFMSTFSGLLVSMTGAMAHDVYGRMLKPKSTPEQRLRAFKVCTVIIGGIAIVLGCFVEPLEINFMVGQAFAIAAASYFPLLFMSVWWRGMTMRGAATGMLTGGLCALAAVTLTNVSNLALDKGPMGKVFAGFAPLNPFWAAHPLLRILCEQPAIWTVPIAIGLMIVIGKLTSRAVPTDTRMKMLVLHAPEKLGLKQEYIQEHQGH